MITLEKIIKKFTSENLETTALNNIDLTINKGDFISIMGSSGSGKSTLLNSIGLLDKATSGSYWFEDQDLNLLSKEKQRKFRAKNLGFIFQNFNLIDELSVYENVELPLLYQGVTSNERKEKVLSILKRLELEHRKDHSPLQLSGGQQQRVAIARAIVTEPKLILADEPTGNLDSKIGEQVMLLLKELNEDLGTTILMVTHSPEHANFTKRIIQMRDGILTEDHTLSIAS